MKRERAKNKSFFPRRSFNIICIKYIIIIYWSGWLKNVQKWKYRLFSELNSFESFSQTIQLECEQIGQFLEFLCNKFHYKSSLNVWWLFGQLWKALLFKSNWATFEKNLGYFFISTSGRLNASKSRFGQCQLVLQSTSAQIVNIILWEKHAKSFLVHWKQKQLFLGKSTEEINFSIWTENKLCSKNLNI